MVKGDYLNHKNILKSVCSLSLFNIRLINQSMCIYKEKEGALAEWCQDNNLSLKVNKMKELIVDFRRQQWELAPIHIDGTTVNQ